MQFTEVKSDGLKREFKIVIPHNHLERHFNERLMRIGQNAKVPGFRPGKVPLPILQQRYGANVQGEALENSIKDAIDRLLTEKKLRVALRPNVTVDKYEQKSDLELSVNLELLPDVTPPKLESLSFEKLENAVVDAEIETVLKDITERNAMTQEVTQARKTKKGDILKIDFEGFVNDIAFEGGTAKGISLELGSNSFIPGFEAQLEGHHAGDSVEVKVTFPEAYHQASLAGKPAIFKTTIHSISEKIISDVTDEFAQKMGFDTVALLKDAVRKSIEADRERMAFLVAKRHVLDDLAAKSSFDVPQGLVDMEFNSIWSQYEARLKADNDSGAKVEKPTEKELEKEKKQYQDIAQRRVRLGLVLAEIGRQYEIAVNRQEVNQAIIETSRRYPGQERQVIEHFQKDENAQASLRAPIFEDKVIRFILEKAKISMKSVTLDELTKAVKHVTEGDDE